MKKRKLIIISNDSLVQEDLLYLATKPGFRQLMEQGCIVPLKSVYPTITYCCHAAMITGCYPNKTGIYANRTSEFGSKDYNWERKNIKVKTLIDCAKENGYTTANVWWPVMANDPNIDWNVPEIWSTDLEKETYLEAQARGGASEDTIRDIIEPNNFFTKVHQRSHPWCELHQFTCARDLLMKKNPDMLIVHPGGIDGYRHKYGVFHPEVTRALDYTYYWIDEIVRTLQEMGEWENTDLILTSDHGHIDVKRRLHINTLLEKLGFITRNETGKVTERKAHGITVGAAAAIYVDDGKQETYDALHKALQDCVKEGIYGISRCYTRQEADEEEHLSGDFDFFLEGDDTVMVLESFRDTIFTPFEPNNPNGVRGNHGYHPDKGPQPVMLMVGPDFKKGLQLPRRSTLDMAATICRIFGWDLPDMDGTVIEEVLNV